MNEVMQTILMFSMIGFHELGHYLFAVVKGYNSKVRFRFYGIEIARPDNMPIEDDLGMCLTGVLFGVPFIYLLSLTNFYWWFLYYVVCTVDITKIIIDIQTLFKYGLGFTERDYCREILKKKN